MATERLTIVIDQRGGREVQRVMDGIGDRANKVARNIRILQNAFFVLGAAGLVRGLVRQLDTLTEFENRLRLTAGTTQQVEAVQQSLFDVARRSRTEFESVAEIYSRAALSLRELGVSTQETLQFTESLAKAAILSGASSREANAALVQLSQGLASNRLSGDELRSVLEQLPFVADIIAKRLKVTRGELREFGRDGKITGEVVLAAFRDARQEIADKFAQTVPTISQAFSVARTNFLQFLDAIDDGSGVSAALARAIIAVSENIEILVIGVTALAGIFATNFIVSQVAQFAGYVNAIRSGIAANRAAVASELERKASIVSTLRARQATIASSVKELQAERALARQKLALAAAEARSAQFTVAGNRARNISTGQFVSLTGATERYNLAQANLTRQQAILLNTERALAAERGRLTLATNAATVATGRLGAAQAASTAGLARFGLAGRLVAGSLGLVGRALSGVIALLGGPIAAAVITVLGLGAAFLKMGNDIEVSTSAGDLGLRDLAQGALQAVGDKIKEVGSFFADVFGGLVDLVRPVFDTIGTIVTDSADLFSSVWNTSVDIVKFLLFGWADEAIAIVAGLFGAWSSIPELFKAIWQKAANLGLQAIAFFVNKAVAGLNKVVGLINGIAEFVGISGRLGEFEGLEPPDFQGDASAEQFINDFTSAYNANKGTIEGAINDSVGGIFDSTVNNARRIRDARDEDALFSQPVKPAGKTKTTTTSGGGGGNKKDFASEIANLEKAIELNKLYGLEKAKLNNLQRIENALKRELSPLEIEQVNRLTEQVEVSRIYGQVLQETQGPLEQLRLTQMALNQLFAEGKITLGQYNDKLKETQIAALKAEGTLAGGFKASLLSNIKSATEFGQAIGDEVVGAVNGLADAFVEFAKTGKLNIKQVFQTLFANLARLAAQQLLLRLLGSAFGLGGGFGGALGGGGSLGFLGLASGGSIMPSGVGSTDTRPLPLLVRPDERVDVLTPRQQRKQAEAMGGGETTVVQAPAPNVVVQITPDDIADALSGEAGDRVVVRGLERNPNAARASLAG